MKGDMKSRELSIIEKGPSHVRASNGSSATHQHQDCLASNQSGLELGMKKATEFPVRSPQEGWAKHQKPSQVYKAGWRSLVKVRMGL